MLWEDVKTRLDKLRGFDAVQIDFAYAPHGDSVFIKMGYVGTDIGGLIVGSGSGDDALEDALNQAEKWTEETRDKPGR